MAEQLALRYGANYQAREQWTALLDVVQSIVQALGLKQVAYDLDVSPSALAHALAERDRHYVRGEWLPYLVTHAPNDRAVELIASWRKLEVKPQQVLTPEQKLARLQSAISEQLGDELAAVLHRAAGIGQ